MTANLLGITHTGADDYVVHLELLGKAVGFIVTYEESVGVPKGEGVLQGSEKWNRLTKGTKTPKFVAKYISDVLHGEPLRLPVTLDVTPDYEA
jgi:hypothetical protein